MENSLPINFKLTLKGDCSPKKNAGKKYWYYTDRNGNKIPMKKPRFEPTPQYKEWVYNSISTLAVFKSNHFINKQILNGQKVIFPITSPIFFTCVFFRSRNDIVDIANLMQSTQDLLIGKPGTFLDKLKTVKGEKQKIPFNHDTYRLISDDNCGIMKNLGGSTVLHDPINPRTDIFISTFTLKIWSEMMKLIHPNLDLSNGVVEQESLFNDSNFSDMGLGGLFNEK